MKESIPHWPRKHYEPGAGDPVLWYTVFGCSEPSQSFSQDKYRSLGLPAGVAVEYHEQSLRDVMRGDFLPRYFWEKLANENPILARAVEAGHGFAIVKGSIKDPDTLDYLRDTVGFLTFLLDCGAAAILDFQTFQWWDSESWRNKIFSPAAAVPRHHVVILVSEDAGGGFWIHTRGIRKFGRPDISVRKVDPKYGEGAVELCNRLIEYQAFGGVIPEGQEIRISGLPPGGIAKHSGSLEDPDFNNVHVEISWQKGT